MYEHTILFLILGFISKLLNAFTGILRTPYLPIELILNLNTQLVLIRH